MPQPSLDIPKWIFAFLAIVLGIVLFMFLIWPRGCIKIASEDYGYCGSKSSSTGLSILAQAEKQTSSAMQYENTFNIVEPGLLLFRASGETTYSGDQIDVAAIVIRLSINGVSCSADRSIFRNASHVSLATSSMCMKVLEPGDYTVVAATTDTGNKNKSLMASYVVLSLKP